MISVEQTPLYVLIPAIAFPVICLLLFIGGLAFLVVGYERLALRSLKHRYTDLAVHHVPEPGDVKLIYHTYHGFLVWFTQTPHEVFLPPDDARTLLGRLLRFNLTWGLASYGMIFIPPLAIGNYWSQRRSIAGQESVQADQ